MYKAGVIGLGRIGAEFEDSHLAAYRDCKQTELVTVADTRAIQGFNTYPHHLLMVMSRELDIVSVCTPVETHCQIVYDIAPFVKAIYCEKPMAVTLEECDKMIEACEKHNTILQINHQRRFVRPVFRVNRRTNRDIINTLTHAMDILGYYDLEDDVDIEEVESDESVFELKFERPRMILAGVEHLVSCLGNGGGSVSDGLDGRLALQRCLEYEASRNK